MLPPLLDVHAAAHDARDKESSPARARFEPDSLTLIGAAIIEPAGVEGDRSLPSCRQTGWMPPARRHLPLRSSHRARTRGAGRIERPDIDLGPTRFVRLVGYPSAVRREDAVDLSKGRLQEHRWRVRTLHRRDPNVRARPRINALIQQKAAVGRVAIGNLGLVGRYEALLDTARSCASGRGRPNPSWRSGTRSRLRRATRLGNRQTPHRT